MTDLKEIRLPDSGQLLHVRRMPVSLLEDFRRTEPPPPGPPMQQVDYGGGKIKEEPNPAHPDYVGMLQDYYAALFDRASEFAIEFGVECEIDPKAIEKVRRWAEKRGAVLPDNDLVLYVTRVLAVTGKDLLTIQSAVFGRVEPTEEAVDKAAESFPGPVQGT